MNTIIQKPIVLFVYNRPNMAKKMYETLKKYQFNKLYVVQDGTKNNNDYQKIIETRGIIERLQNNTQQLIKIYRNKNIGLKESIESGIDRVFQNESAAIFLEDDCIPSISFFQFSEDILDYYEKDTRIGMVTGYNHFGKYDFGGYSFGFSQIGSIWGWGTWKDRWEKHDKSISLINDEYVKRNLKHKINDKRIAKIKLDIWMKYHLQVKSNSATSWDFQWGFSRMINSYLAIVPRRNLISNIGVGEDSTHNKYNKNRPYDKSVFLTQTYDMDNELIYPKFVLPDYEYDFRLDIKNNPSRAKRIVSKLKNHLKF